MQEQQVLSSRLVAQNKKLTLETKIRDAAVSLSKANATYKSVNKQTSEQLDSANRKVENAQKELWRISERANEVQRKLLEHRAGVLSHSVRSLERKNAPPDASDTSGYSTPSRTSQLSPVTASSATSIQSMSSKGRFDGAHFFAGHSEAILPHSPQVSQSKALANGPSPMELEEKLKGTTIALEAAAAKQAEIEQELSLIRLEKEETERSLGLELQSAEEFARSLQEQLQRYGDIESQLRVMEEERDGLLGDRVELEERRHEVEDLKQRIQELEAKSGEAVMASEGALAIAAGAHMAELQKRDEELHAIKRQLEEERAAWSLEKATLMGDMTDHVVKLQQDAAAGSGSKAQLDELTQSLSALIQAHGVEVAAGPAPAALVAALGRHLEDVQSHVGEHALAQEDWAAQRSQLEDEAHSLAEKNQILSKQLDNAMRERDEARVEVRNLELQIQVCCILHLVASLLPVEIIDSGCCGRRVKSTACAVRWRRR